MLACSIWKMANVYARTFYNNNDFWFNIQIELEWNFLILMNRYVDNTCSPLLIVVIGERQGWSLALARFWIFVFDGLPHLSTPASNYHLTLINLD